MGKPTGFIDYERVNLPLRSVNERLQDYRQVAIAPESGAVTTQAARCMDCGIPFCHVGCPLGNHIPEWNHLVHQGKWEEAWAELTRTNNFPEFTGRVCPAPCESACVAGVGGDPVAIEQIEWAISDMAFWEGVVRPKTPMRTGKVVAVIGSGPAGLACADQLNAAGHSVTVFERGLHAGGLLRYGIPDFKLEKWVVERRVALMEEEGVVFRTGVEVGTDVGVEDLDAYDAVVLCTGATKPRDLSIPGRDLSGVHFAWDYLNAQNRVVGGELDAVPAELNAAGRHVVVIGGGDTGSDCVGTANRQGAASVTQLELLPTPPSERPEHQPWPYMPMVLKTTSSHQEGVERQWSLMTQAFVGDGALEGLEVAEVKGFDPVAGTGRTLAADMALLAVGYTGPEQALGSALGLKAVDGRLGGADYKTSRDGFFAAGDARRGQSLVVWAISEGREAARAVDQYLMGDSQLPTKRGGDLPRR